MKTDRGLHLAIGEDQLPIMTKSHLARGAAAFVLLASVMTLGSAQAQIESQGGPILVTAESLDYVGPQAIATYRGNVEAVQGQTRLRCSQLQLFQERRNNGGAITGGDIQRYECAGPVYYVTPTEQAKGDAATYTVANNTIVMTGNVVVQQGQNVAEGYRLTINTVNRNTRLESANAGRGANNRVRTVIYPDESNGSQQRGAPPARSGAGGM